MLALLASAVVAAPPLPGLIAFVGRKDGQIDIFTIRSDGGDLRQVTNDAPAEAFPVWSPDGRRIAYHRIVSTTGTPDPVGGSLCVINADGTGRVQLSNTSIQFRTPMAWSPDGSRIAFGDTATAANSGLSVVSGSGGSAPVRVSEEFRWVASPYWGQDNRIYFRGSSSTQGYGIYAISPDGTGPARLAEGQAKGPIRRSPDGQRVAYVAADQRLTIASGDGSAPLTLTTPFSECLGWTPDGRRLLYIETSTGGLNLVASTDGQPAQAFQGTNAARAASVSPDGRNVAVIRNEPGAGNQTNLEIWLVSLESREMTRVPSPVTPVATEGVPHIAWAPTGDSVAPPSTTPVTPPVTPSSGGGFPGTPVGPDRAGAPLGPAKTAGTALAVTAPESITVGDAFFGPEPLKIGVRRSGAVANANVSLAATAPAGVTATFGGSGADRTLALRGLSSLPIGEHTLTVRATAGTTTTTLPIRIVRKPARILLVDDDYAGNNAGLDKDPAAFARGSLSPSDTFYRTMLERGNGARSLIYDTVGVDMYGNGPDVEKMKPYDFVLWYNGTSYGGNPDGTAVFSGVDESNIRAYLQEGGGRAVMMVGAGYASRVARGTPRSPSNDAHWTETDSTFLQKAMGVKGGRGLHARFVDADLTANGQTFMMGKGPLEAQLSPINPDTATALVTAELDPDRKGKRPVPVAVWNRVGDASLIYVGFTLENVTVRQERLAGLLLGIRIPGMNPL
jgi:Tol biopolymer transport system component